MASILRGMGRHHLDTGVTQTGSSITTYHYSWKEFPLLFVRPDAGTLDIDQPCAVCRKPIQVRLRSDAVLRSLRRRGGAFVLGWVAAMAGLGWWFFTNMWDLIKDDKSVWSFVSFFAALALVFGPILWGMSLIESPPLVLRKGSTKRHDVDRLEVVP